MAVEERTAAEYVQLVQTPEGWKIVNALWELT